ncbi:MBL fold metallo-hydrolase [Streptosporangium canum]|uniref:MBL fold metallo-hydrolase n=1 Tax=Streptosporangium canum TaxID=324952 RepID=UPI00378EAB76
MEGRWIEVADRVLVRRYAELDLSVGLVMGDGGCLVVDTRGDERQGAELAAEVRRITRDPWTVVITHSHFDHSFGTRPFLECPVWAQEGCRADLAEDGARTRESWARRYREEGRAGIADDIAGTEIVLPDHLVTDRAELAVGGRGVVMSYFGRGHSGNDLVVHVPDAGVVFAGDLVENGAPPAYGDAYPLEWPVAVDGLLGLTGDGAVVVPGHGDPVDRGFVVAQRAEIAAVAGLCREVAAGRMSVQEAVRLSPYPEDTTRTALLRPAGD